MSKVNQSGQPVPPVGGLLDKFLQHAEPGQASMLRFLVDEGMVTGFIIREDEEHIRALPAQPMIEVRSALLVEDGIGVVAILARIEGEIYETWFNRHFEGLGLAECLDDLALQERLFFGFYAGRPQPERIIWMPNHPRDSFERILHLISAMEPWSMEAFNMARMSVLQRYPDLQSLWEACGPE